ncbi:radical SAM protein [Acinetobacter oleivorans]|uniref:radical SAM protein n=1 Tax=Acinetobacter oleivorans TaxID=1148157 RepID=UPI003A837F7A
MLLYAPEIVRIDITGRCNLRCTHCQANMFLGKKSLELTTDQWKKVLKELANEGAITVGFLGGEPFLRKDFIELLRYANGLGLKTTVTTNGTLIQNDVLDILINETNTYTVFSLDGPNFITHDIIRGNGQFNKTLERIRYFSNEQIKKSKNLLGISSTLHKTNLACFTDIFTLCKDLKVNSLSIAEVHSTGRATENWDILKIENTEFLKICEKIAFFSEKFKIFFQIRLDLFPASYREYLKRNLNIYLDQEIRLDRSSINECYIQHDGLVFPSQQFSTMIPNVLKNAEEIGIFFKNNSLKEYDFKKIWRGDEFNKYRRYLLNSNYVQNMKPCNMCKFKNTYCQPSFGKYLLKPVIANPLCDFVFNI